MRGHRESRATEFLTYLRSQCQNMDVLVVTAEITVLPRKYWDTLISYRTYPNIWTTPL